MMQRWPLALSVVVAIALLGGCSGGDIEGRVIRGAAGVVTVVAAGSERADQPGVKDASIELRAVGRSASGPVIGVGTTDADGRFSVSYSDLRMVRDRLQLVARAPGYSPVQDDFFLPSGGRLILVVMKPGTPAPPPATVGSVPPGSKPGE